MTLQTAAGQDARWLLALCLLWPAPASAVHADDLWELSLSQLLAVPVSVASRHPQRQTEAPAILTVITREEIARYGANSLYEVLERLPSVYMTGSFFFPQNVLSMRGDLLGHYDNHVLILLNGRPVRESYGGGVNFPVYNALPLAVIERIEVIRGPGSPLYGTNAYAAVLNVITGDSDRQPERLRLTAGSFGTAALEASGARQSEHADWVFGLKTFHEDGWKQTYADNNGVRDTQRADENNVGLFVNGLAGDFQLNLLYLRSQQNFIGSVASWSGTPPAEQREITGSRFLVDVGHQLDLSESAYVETNLSHGVMNFGFYGYDAYSRDSLLESIGHWQVTPQLRWLLGGNYWDQRVGSAASRSSAPVRDFQTYSWEIYTQLDAEPTEDLSLYAGLQVNKPQNLSHDVVPRVGLAWQLDHQWGVKLLYSEAYRAPFGVETNVDIVVRDNLGNITGGLRGNPGLEPERVANWDAQVNYHGSRNRFAATLFRSRQRNLVTRQRAPDNILDFVNQGSLTLRGLELEGEHRFGGRVSLGGSYTYQENEDATGIENFTGVPNHMLKLALSLALPAGWDLGLHQSWFSHAHDIGNRSPARADVNPDADAYSLVTVNLRSDLSPWCGGCDSAAAALYIHNLLDADVHQPEFIGRRIDTVPARGGRAFYVNLDLPF